MFPKSEDGKTHFPKTRAEANVGGFITPHFHFSEMDCRDGTPIPDHLLSNVITLCTNLEIIRKAVGAPLHINSCYRHAAYNKKVGGVPSSQHLTASAADFTVKHLTPVELGAIIKDLIKRKQVRPGGIGIYKGFVHYDIRGRLTEWSQ